MDTASPLGSSNVTVEYTDPSGLFSVFQSVIERKLPLRNLHWKSPNRPARSIESLRIGFVPAGIDGDERATTTANATGTATTSSDTAAASTTTTTTTTSTTSTTSTTVHRRHQIPGLRQTPYLKIYLLQCDDNETYKTSTRKTLREWIKTHGSTPLSGGVGSVQEKHDAFEWLIVHIVQEIDGPEKHTASSSTTSLASASKWGRGTTTVFEKVKADFTSSSKSSVDRVAQLRLPPRPKGVSALQSLSAELAEQVDDLVEKMQTGILASFDQRVAQYEEDIKEKDSQRSLPGWNFCMFFILKEGLARGFEDVGLYEDALVSYDELSVGLETTIREQLQGSGEQHGAALLSSSLDWQEQVTKILESTRTTSVDEAEHSDQHTNGEGEEKAEEYESTDGSKFSVLRIDEHDFPLDSSKKPYRDMILANNISIFDFRAYVFSRQLTLLLRAARAPWLAKRDNEAEPRDGKSSRKPEDFLLLAEICERAIEFIATAARTLTYDLEGSLANVTDPPEKLTIIKNFVSSWEYAAVAQILTQTYTPNLTISESSLRVSDKDATTIPGYFADIRPDVPRRSSSLLSPTTIRSSMLHSPSSPEFQKTTIRPAPKTGSEQLASGRGELLSFARRVFEKIAARQGWTERWQNLNLLFEESRSTLANGFDEVSLEEDHNLHSQQKQATTPSVVDDSAAAVSLSGIELPVLRLALRSKKAFRTSYEDLTDQIFRHYIEANRTYSAEMTIAEIALLRFNETDYAAAASYFHQIAPFYASKRWAVLEGAMLEMYARCLKELNRTEEYVRMLLRLLAKFAAYRQEVVPALPKLQSPSAAEDTSRVSSYVEELSKFSAATDKEFSVALTDFFADFRVDPAIVLYDDRDGFKIRITMRFLLAREITLDSIKLRLISALESQNNEQWLQTSAAKIVVKSSQTSIFIDSAMTLQGKYYVDRIELRAGNLIFIQASGSQPASPMHAANLDPENTRPYIFCYPRPDSLCAKVGSPHLVNLDEMRTIELELNSGKNDIKSGTIRVRPATAGLRLRLSESQLVHETDNSTGAVEIKAKNDMGNIEFGTFVPGSLARLRIPYTIEENHAQLSVRVEVWYETEHGRFAYSAVFGIVSALPISVNVQDMFKDDVLFCRFTISPATSVPLRVLECSIPSSEHYEVQSSIRGPVLFDIFPKQPASLLYKIRQRQDCDSASGTRRSLRLTVEFTCVDDECLDTVAKKLKDDMEASRFRKHALPLTAHLVEKFRSRLSSADLEVIGLTRQIETLAFEAVGWDELLSAIVGTQMAEVRVWLKQWHQKNHMLPMPERGVVRSRKIVIPVDIPDVQVVHTAEVQLELGQEHEPVAAAVGQMISAEIRIHHTRRWGYETKEERQTETPGRTPPLEFSYEVHANPELWLVGGRRRGNFSASEGQVSTFAIMLLPQKAGHLLLPGLEIKTFLCTDATGVPTSTHMNGPAVAGAATAAAAPAAVQRKPIPCEVHYRNHAETVLVLPNLRKTTVSLAAASGNHPGGGPWLVESERRAQASRAE